MKKLFLIALLFNFSISIASELEGIIGANYTNYEESNETKSGIGANLKYNMYQDTTGWFAHGLFRGETILNVDATIGYGYKSSGSSFFETGIGLSVNPFFGNGIGLTLGAGTELGSGWYVNLMGNYFGGGLTYVMITPMFGRKF